MAGMRNRLVHEYFAIRLDVVWQTVVEDIPPLIDRLDDILPGEANAQNAGESASDD